ncbi:hypothetical protein FACS18949_10780 [Clostridia bacterium]|nr:hypothetical protein FACS18949_10780 [Clostridia bacterium]
MKKEFHESFEKFTRLVKSRIVTVTVLVAVAFAVMGQSFNLQNLFVIMDGDTLILYRTFKNDVRAVLSDAGVTIDSYNDTYTASGLKNQGGISEVTVSHGSYVTIKADNRTVRLRTFGESVSALLARAQIELRGYDEVDPEPGMPTSDGMEIVVTRWGADQRVETEVLPFETLRVPQKRLLAGEENLLQTGVNGELERVYQRSLRDGDVSREFLLRETVTREPVQEIIEYGTGGTVNVGGVLRKYKKALDVSATAYTTEGFAQKNNASGKLARPGTIAVDPRVIPLGTVVYVEAPNGRWVYGVAVAEDTGGGIKGNKIDLFFDTLAECYEFGRRPATVYILE